MRWLAVPAALVLGSPALVAAEFIRGDINGDGVVTVADSHHLGNHLFVGAADPTCLDAADFNGDGVLDLSDVVALLLFSVGEVEQPPAPFPEVGEPQEALLGCESYGGGDTLDDPTAQITLHAADVPGGLSRRGSLRVEITSEHDIAGYRFDLSFPEGLIAAAGKLKSSSDLSNLSGKPGSAPIGVRKLTESTLSVGWSYLMTPCLQGYPDCEWIAAPESTVVLEVLFCVAEGTPAGTYDLTGISGELVAVGGGSNAVGGIRIDAPVEGTSLTVLSDVGAVTCDPDPGPPPTPPDVIFRLDDASGVPGSLVAVPFSIEANVPSQGFSFSVDFDESAVGVESFTRRWTRPSGTPYEFERFEFNNTDEDPGNDGVQEGYVVGAAIISLVDTADVLPPGESVAVLDINMRIRSDAEAGSTEISFADGGINGDGTPVGNHLIAGGESLAPEEANSFIFVNAAIAIVGDGTPFVRGDSNDDGQVDISDSLRTLNFLFSGNVMVTCLDAADSNDDGGVNIADALYSLEYLFGGGPTIPEPYPIAGSDPTPDSLLCN